MNALKHGLLANTVVLPNEDPDRFAALLQDLIDDLQPQTRDQMILVENLAVARWRTMRAWCVEAAAIAARLADQPESLDPAIATSRAFERVDVETRIFNLAARMENLSARQYFTSDQRLTDKLRKFRRAKKSKRP